MWFPGYYKIAWWRAGRALSAGQKAKAVRILESLVRHRPKDPMAWLSYAKMLVRLGEGSDAERLLRRALALHPDSLFLRSLFADVLYNAWDFDEARREWEDIRRDHPEAPDSYKGLAGIALYGGDWKRVSQLIDESLARHPDPYMLMDTAILLAAVPAERGRAKDLLLQVTQAPKLRRDPTPHLLLSMLLEESDAEASAEHMAIARKHWHRGPPGTLAYLQSRTRERLRSGTLDPLKEPAASQAEDVE